MPITPVVDRLHGGTGRTQVWTLDALTPFGRIPGFREEVLVLSLAILASRSIPG
jgi:hypothetical protein